MYNISVQSPIVPDICNANILFAILNKNLARVQLTSWKLMLRLGQTLINLIKFLNNATIIFELSSKIILKKMPLDIQTLTAFIPPCQWI